MSWQGGGTKRLPVVLGLNPGEDHEHLVMRPGAGYCFRPHPSAALLLTKGTAQVPHGVDDDRTLARTIINPRSMDCNRNASVLRTFGHPPKFFPLNGHRCVNGECLS